MATRRLNQNQEISLAQSQSSIKWILEGRTLLVNDRVLNVVRDCQVVFYPERLKSVMMGDIIESVEFWFRYPVAQGVLYVLDQRTSLLKPADDTVDLSQVSNSHEQWLIRFTGRTARAVRRLYRQL